MVETMKPIMQDPYTEIKERQKKGWAHYIGAELFTIPEAAKLVRFANVQPGQRVLDVATGTGPVALAAAERGAKVTAVDFTPELLAHAEENAALAGISGITWKEADVEDLPFRDGSFDVVLSEFGHIFGPRHRRVADEMLRVLKPGGTIAFSTWPSHGVVGLTFTHVAAQMPPPPANVQIDSPLLWGDPGYIRQVLGERVRDYVFDGGTLVVPALSPNHLVKMQEEWLGPVITIKTMLQDKPEELAKFRRGLAEAFALYRSENQVRHDYLKTRAVKA